MKCKLSCLFAVFFVYQATVQNSWSQTPRVAILDSANTRLYFGIHYASCSPPTSFTLGAEEYQRYFRGWEYVVQNNNIPYDIIFDTDVVNGRLDQYDLLILSNTASLSDDEDKAIDRWVRGGGNLLATFGSGYKDVTDDPHQPDNLKVRKGGTTGLHQLWHDPLNKLVSSLFFSPGSDVQITRYEGPTAGLQGLLKNDILPYGAGANLLVQRPAGSDTVLGFVNVSGYDRAAPAIISTKAAHGRVVYLSFAPEYIVSKEFDLPKSLSCPDGQNWAGRSTELRVLMRDAVLDLLNN